MAESYQKGNTRERATEWEFNFVVSRPELERIPEQEMADLFDKFLDSVVAGGYQLGGSFSPILDEDYERLNAEEPPDFSDSSD